MREWVAAEADGSAVADDDQLALLFACCHPALDPASRVTLTLRVVCGLPAVSCYPASRSTGTILSTGGSSGSRSRRRRA
jgi:predicted RNA polymerase sigma factor